MFQILDMKWSNRYYNAHYIYYFMFSSAAQHIEMIDEINITNVNIAMVYNNFKSIHYI